MTELKGLRQQLERSRRDYKRLFEAVPCYICVVDRDLVVLECNTLYRREFGDAIGSRCFEACKGRSAPCRDCLVTATFADGEAHSSEETLTTQDGRRLDLVVHSMPVHDDRGAITSVMEVFTDITEVKRLQSQLALMGRAVAGMAHRVKNILMGLEGGIFVVNTGMESGDQETTSEGWKMVERNVVRISRTVKDLLFCAKSREPRLEDGVLAHDIVADVHELFGERLAGEEIEIRVEQADPQCSGTFDPDGIHSLLCNLVSNAIDACRFDPDEGKREHHITLRCAREGDDTVVLEVEDDGSGIPEELSDRVFQDFFSTKGTEGTGVGLLVVQKIAEEHGGSVSFTTEPGRGTTFRVALPVRPPSGVEGLAPEPAAARCR